MVCFCYRGTRDRESGDYAGSDAQSVSSRLSMLSMDTSRSDQHDIPTPYFTHYKSKSKQFRKSSNYARSEDGASPSQSSDYEDQDDFSCTQQAATVHAVRILSYKLNYM